jgi:peptidyl-prolyl cis-trans isomerase D
MRKHATSWLIKVILFAIVVVFIFWGVGSYKNRRASQVASVNGEIIAIEEYRKAYNNLIDRYRQQFGTNLDEKMLEMMQIDKQAINMLVDQRLVLQEARKLNLAVTETELAESIRQMPIFQENGRFDSRRYRLVLNNARLSTEEFEEGQRRQMISDKVRNLFLDGVKVSDRELKEWFNWENTEVNIAYLEISMDRYADIQPGDDEIAAYFEEHKDNYKTEPKVAVKYLKFDPKAYLDRMQTDQEEIREYYEANPEEFSSEKTVEARHILFKVDEGVDEKVSDEKRAKALEVLAMARGGQDFAELAKQYSEGPTKDKGGYLGVFPKNRMVKPFADQAFRMQADEISEPVKTQFGWHIIKVEKVNEASTETLEDASAAIEKKLNDNKANSLAYDEAEETYEAIFENEDLARLARDKGMELVSVAAFTLAKGPQGGPIGNPREFAKLAFELPLHEISEVQDFGDGFYLIQATEKIAAEIPPLDDVREKVKGDLVKSLQDKKANGDAGTILAALKEGKDMAAEGAKFGLTVEESGFFKRSGSIPKIGYERDILTTAFALTAEKRLPEEVVKGAKGYYLIRLLEKRAPAAEGFEAEKDKIESRILDQKRRKVYETWISELKSRSDIVFDERFLE